MSEAGLRHLTETEDRAVDTAVPVYRRVKKGTPELIGSAVLLAVGDAKLICSAAHVLDARDGAELFLPHNDTVQAFAMKPFVTQVPASGRRSDDKYDFAIAELSEEESQRFSRYRFIPLSQMDPDNVPQSQSHYLFVGYPASKNKSRSEELGVRADLARYGGRPLGIEAYKRYAFNTSIHLLIEFNPKKMVDAEGNILTPANPHGISGGAVWYVGDTPEIEAGTNAAKFVGIGMEYRSDALIAVRIAFLLEAMRSLFPRLSPAIPHSKWIGVGVTIVPK